MRRKLLKIKGKKYDRKEISVHLFGRNMCKVINKVIFCIYNSKGCKYLNISANNRDDDWDDEDNSSILIENIIINIA